MNVLFVSWELDPLFKKGGLGDVARSLPYALKKQGVDIRIALPYYSELNVFSQPVTKIGEITVEYGGEKEVVGINKMIHPTTLVPVYLLSNEKYLSQATSPETFVFFNFAIVEIVMKNIWNFSVDIIHCNDHHAGFIPLLIRKYHMDVATMLTIHNLSYVGPLTPEILGKINVSWQQDQKEPSKITLLREGLTSADIITTVSPAYAMEIMTPAYGGEFAGLLKERQSRVFGILNGIDSGEAGDADFLREIRNDWAVAKAKQKKRARELFGLPDKEETPLFCFVGRLDPRQKGIDLLYSLVKDTRIKDFQLALLGTGDKYWEEQFTALAKLYPQNLACKLMFDPQLAGTLYSGSDFIIVPSKFEPCGLIQMIAMNHGTLPIAHRTGGLKNTIHHNYDGFIFNDHTPASLEESVNSAVHIWKNEKERYKKMVERAIKKDFSWDKSAGEYIILYEKLVRGVFW